MRGFQVGQAILPGFILLAMPEVVSHRARPTVAGRVGRSLVAAAKTKLQLAAPIVGQRALQRVVLVRIGRQIISFKGDIAAFRQQHANAARIDLISRQAVKAERFQKHLRAVAHIVVLAGQKVFQLIEARHRPIERHHGVAVAKRRGAQKLFARLGKIIGAIIDGELGTVAAGAQRRAHDAGVGAAKFCGIAAGLQLEFFNCLLNDADIFGVEERVGCIRAVDIIGDFTGAATANIQRAVLLHHTGAQRHNVLQATHRQVLNIFLGCQTHCVRRIALHQRAFRHDFERPNLNRRGRELEILAGRQAGAHSNIGEGQRLVTDIRYLDRVNARGNTENNIIAPQISRGPEGCSLKCNIGADQGIAGFLICDLAAQLAILRQQQGRQQEHNANN
ncbi:MAG: hypothetical protein ALAOOOJD_03742 [bacterium]|nr:hypothetical protein [bacterium]